MRITGVYNVFIFKTILLRLFLVDFQFEKSRFGGTLSAAAKPNVNLTRRPVEVIDVPIAVPDALEHSHTANTILVL